MSGHGGNTALPREACNCKIRPAGRELYANCFGPIEQSMPLRTAQRAVGRTQKPLLGNLIQKLGEFDQKAGVSVGILGPKEKDLPLGTSPWWDLF